MESAKTEINRPSVKIMERNPNGTFLVGNSGKPKGARHMATLLRDAIKEVAIKGKNARPIDVEIVRKLAEKARRGDLKAIDMVLDRVDGKVEQAIDLTSGGETLGMSAEQRAKLDSLLNNA